jgi:hypothetical protein
LKKSKVIIATGLVLVSLCLLLIAAVLVTVSNDGSPIRFRT